MDNVTSDHTEEMNGLEPEDAAPDSDGGGGGSACGKDASGASALGTSHAPKDAFTCTEKIVIN